MKVTFVLGMSGAGKSHWIRNSPDIDVYYSMDFQDLRNEAPHSLNMYTAPIYSKLIAMWLLVETLQRKEPHIVIECVGMTGQGQAAVRALAEAAQHYKYEVEIVYIRPVNVVAFEESILLDEQATRLLTAWRTGHPRFCRPPDAECLQGIPMTIIDTFTEE